MVGRYVQGTSKVHPRYIQGTSKIHPRYIQGTSKILGSKPEGSRTIREKFQLSLNKVGDDNIVPSMCENQALGARYRLTNLAYN